MEMVGNGLNVSFLWVTCRFFGEIPNLSWTQRVTPSWNVWVFPGLMTPEFGLSEHMAPPKPHG
jgi:hypothetical protein